jgi:EmrB/QacA subfamily drug resistance transporter
VALHSRWRQRNESSPGVAPSQASSDADHRPWSFLVVLCVAQFMVLLDMSVTTVALPSIGRSLGFAPADLQWVVTSYLLATGGLTLLGGRAADLLGGRRMFTAGLVLFTTASLASGLAPDAAALLAARAAQGVGAALLTPAALALITACYSGAQRATALSAWGGLAGAGVAAGALLGGVLTSWLGWRSVFLINVPVGLGALHASRRLLPSAVAGRGAGRSRPGSRWRDLDLPGAILAVTGLVALAYGISRQGWGASRVIALAAAAIMLAAFALAEQRAGRDGRVPLLPLGMLRSRTLSLGGLALLAATGLQIGVILLSSLFLQGVTGASAVRTGLEFLPPVLLTGAVAGLAAHLMGKAGSRVLATVGFACMAGGAVLLSRVGADSGYLAGLLPGLLLMGAGSGLAFPSAQVTGLSQVPAEMAGLAAGLMTTGHEIGASLGAAIFPAVAAGVAGFAAGGPGFVGGYRHALLVAAIAAGALAALTAIALPVARPAPGTRVSLH